VWQGDAVADPFEDAFAQIGDDFEAIMPGLQLVTVTSIDPDSGAALVTVTEVPAFERGRRRNPFRVGEGEVGNDQTRFLLKAARLEFLVKGRDTITEADGTSWSVDDRGAELIGKGQIWALNVTINR
jgi:hypothetical protein